MDEQSCFSSARRGSEPSKHEVLSSAALTTPLSKNIPAQSSLSKVSSFPAFLCSQTSAQFVLASPEALLESVKVKARKLFITTAHRNAISLAFRQGAVLIYRLMNFK